MGFASLFARSNLSPPRTAPHKSGPALAVDKIPVFVSALQFMAITGDMPVHFRLSMLLFVLAVLGSALSSFLSSGLSGRTWIRCVVDGILAGAAFFFAGIVPFLTSVILPDIVQRLTTVGGFSFYGSSHCHSVYLDEECLEDSTPKRSPKLMCLGLYSRFPWLVFSISLAASIAILLFLVLSTS